MLKYPNEIKDMIRRTDEDISKNEKNAIKIKNKIPIILLGGSAIMLAHSGKRWTEDIDIMHHPSLKNVGQYLDSFHVVSDAIAFLHPDYLERIQKQYELKNLEVGILHPIDIIIAKTARGLSKDFHDIYSSEITSSIDTETFREMYTEAMGYWLGNEEDFLRKMETTIELMETKKILVQTNLLEEFRKNLERITLNGLIADTVEVKALEIISSSNYEEMEKSSKGDKKTMNLAKFLISTIGQSIVDNKETVLIGEIIREHFSRVNSHDIKNKENQEVNGDFLSYVGRATKLFKTVATKTISSLSDEQKKMLTGFQSPQT